MKRMICGLVFVLGTACLNVPPGVEPVQGVRKATVVVDNDGAYIVGGNLSIDIPKGAVAEGERIRVTIDEILGAPEGHLNDTYLVGPQDYEFLQPVQMSYQYKQRWIDDLVDAKALFLGVARGLQWARLDNAQNDVDLLRARGELRRFSVHGLVDPNTPNDGGVIVVDDDAGFAQDAIQDDVIGDAGGFDNGSADVSAQDDIFAQVPSLQLQLWWDGTTSDMDLHLLRHDSQVFSDDDCHYVNCKNTSLPWPPSGEAGDPIMDIDDLEGLGPENIRIARLAGGDYSVGVHVWSIKNDTLPMNFRVRIFHNNVLVDELTGTCQQNKEFFLLGDIIVSSDGLTLGVTPRYDAPVVLDGSTVTQ